MRRSAQGSVKESPVVRDCIRWLHLHGCDVVRQNTGSAYREYTTKAGIRKRYLIRFGKKGLGDITAISPRGRWIEVECKSATGDARFEQIARQQEVERRNGVYVLARSIDDLEARKEHILRG